MHGVCRAKGRVVPSIIFQEGHANDKKKSALSYGTMNEATLRGDPKCIDLIAMSISDSKPVYFCKCQQRT